MARNPQKQVLVHSDQGSQYTSHEWQSFLKSHGLEGSMSRRGNCHDNAVAESFFQLLKRERIKKKIYGTREEARSDIFDYIEMFYNSKRRHGSSDQMLPTEYENQYYQWTDPMPVDKFCPHDEACSKASGLRYRPGCRTGHM
jgi:putative transposase